jgi:hypothetical protein
MHHEEKKAALQREPPLAVFLRSRMLFANLSAQRPRATKLGVRTLNCLLARERISRSLTFLCRDKLRLFIDRATKLHTTRAEGRTKKWKKFLESILS